MLILYGMKLITGNREQLNLLGYFMELIVASHCDNPQKTRNGKRRVNLLIKGGRMAVCLAFEGSNIHIMPVDEDLRPHITVSASLNTFLDISLGGSVVKAFLLGKVKLRGNLIRLLFLLKWLRLDKEA
ncbi:MAG: hypothetical protein IEMM0008_1866 [bacterium]|nr:MAG: hypothetical protein IEMM0008_1866 [bacterium]